jgi:hypothetical protein
VDGRLTFAEARQKASLETNSETLRPYYERLHVEGNANKTLNLMRLSSAAMEEGEWKEAEKALDEVIVHIETLGPADEQSRKALSNFKEEEIKRFKGEPYERSMVYFLRGLLHLRHQDWSNARACFKSVQIHDAVAEKAQNKADWVSAEWLEGWCARQMGGHADAEAQWKKTANKLPAPEHDHDTLAIALLGFGPVKLPEGKHGAVLGYREGDQNITRVELVLPSGSHTLKPAENLFSQAKARGSRHMDKVNVNKASVKDDSNTAGDVLTVGGVGTTMAGVYGNNDTVAAAGLGATVVGLAVKGFSNSIKPKSDARNWDLLPANIHLQTFKAPPTSLQVECKNSGNTLVSRKILPGSELQTKLVLIIER